jgi:hypothetical protein
MALLASTVCDVGAVIGGSGWEGIGDVSCDKLAPPFDVADCVAVWS